MKSQRLTASELPQEIVAVLQSHSLFTSSGFAELWNSVNGHPIYWCARGDDESIMAILTTIEFGKNPLVRLQAMPDGCYANIIFLSEDCERDKVIENLLSSIRKHGYTKVHIYDYSNDCNNIAGFEIETCTTSLVDISSSRWQPPDSKIRSEIRKSEREGVTIERYDSRKHSAEFYSLVIKTEKRHGRKAKYSAEFFNALAELAESDERVVWLVAMHDNTMSASHIYFVERNTGLYWQAYSDNKLSHLKSNQHLLSVAVGIMQEKGAKFLNMGATPDGASSLEKFKDKWGGIKYEYQVLIHKNLIGKFV